MGETQRLRGWQGQPQKLVNLWVPGTRTGVVANFPFRIRRHHDTALLLCCCCSCAQWYERELHLRSCILVWCYTVLIRIQECMGNFKGGNKHYPISAWQLIFIGMLSHKRRRCCHIEWMYTTADIELADSIQQPELPYIQSRSWINNRCRFTIEDVGALWHNGCLTHWRLQHCIGSTSVLKKSKRCL